MNLTRKKKRIFVNLDYTITAIDPRDLTTPLTLTKRDKKYIMKKLLKIWINRKE